MKKLIIFGLAGLFTLLCAFTILIQAREKMRVVSWAPPVYGDLGDSHWRNFPQIDSCFMNALLVRAFVDEDFDSASHYGFELVESLAPHTSLVTGQQSIYEADTHYYRTDLTPVYFNGYFSLSNRVGREEPDPYALNEWAWYADPDSDDAGYVMRDLKSGYVGYNTEQGIPHEYDDGGTITFYADFLIKISDTTYQADPFLILKAILMDGTDTVVLASREVRPQDFQYPNQYDTLSLTFTRTDNQGDSLDYSVWWDGSRAVWIDRIKIRDAFADSLFGGLYDGKIDSLSEQQGRDTLLTAWYLVDQPDDDQYASQAYLHAYLNSHQYPHGVQSLQVYFHKVDEYLSVVNPKELWFNYYPFGDTVDTATTGGNLQTSLSNLAGCLNIVKQKAISHGKPFLYIAQAYEELPRHRRYPTEFEQKVLAWLGLAHGANGIAYFVYASYGTIKGLVDPNDDTTYYVPHEPNWSAVQSVNSVIDSIGWLFADTSSWKGAGHGDTVASIPGSFIDSLKSAEFDSAWIEVGFFQDSAQTDYFMLVNRRCLSTEEQNVTVYMDSVQLGNNKMWYVIDQYSQDTTFTGAINGKIPFTTHLDPGEGKLFKLASFPDSAFHGTAHPLIWQGGIMVDGDVTVDSGKILVIQPPGKITFFANTDVVKTPDFDTTDCDFIVYGSLRAAGTLTDSIVFTSTENNPNDWEGIYVDEQASSGATILSHCVVEYAYIGIQLLEWVYWNPDTISNSRFSDNLAKGMHIENDQARIIHNTISRDPVFGGPIFYGLYVWDVNTGTTPSVTRNIITNCNMSMYIGCSSTKVNKNVISTTKPGAYGMRCSCCPNLVIDKTSVTGDSIEFGFWISTCAAEITNCSAKGTSGHPAQYGALFQYDMGSSMHRTDIENFCERGVWCYRCDQYKPDLGTESNKGYNRIFSDSGYLVYHDAGKRLIGSSVDSVKAQYNWWGEYPPDSSRFSGPVVYMPALTNSHIPDPVYDKVAYDGNVPEEFQLLQNYPNPFNPVTSIQFTVGSSQTPVRTTLKIYNILGQLVRSLVDEEKTEGAYTVHWDGCNTNDEKVSSGIYFCKLEAGEFREVKKMVLLR